MLALALIVGSAVTLRAQQTKMLTADKHNEYGLVYSLPTTAMKIEVTASRTVVKAGPYHLYAKRYIGTDKVESRDHEVWTITDVKVTPYGVADAKQRYLMQLKAGALTSICVDADGMLLAINKEVETLPESPESAATGPKLQPFTGKEYLKFVGEDFLASQSSAKQAQMLAENLMEVREAKIALTRGQAETMPTDGKQLELMLNSLKQQEAALTAAFVGTRQTETVKRTYTFTPGDAGRTLLFRMSEFAGFVAADDYSGEPVYLEISGIKKSELPVNEKGETKEVPKDGVAYCIPGEASLKISFKGVTLLSTDFEASQYGVVFGLNPSLFTSKKEPSFAIFNPSTGALVTIGSTQF